MTPDAVPIDDERILVGGAWRPAAASFTRENPARPREMIGRFGAAGPGDVDDAVAAARDARGMWAKTPAPQRGEILWRAAQVLRTRVQMIATELTRETGKPIRDARGEVARAIDVLEFFAGEGRRAAGEVLESNDDGVFLHTRRRALGVVCVITPWNFPLVIPAWKIAPALAFGNTVVWKASELAPTTALRFTEALVEGGVPAGVVNLLNGPPVGMDGRLARHPDLDGLTFTGSNAVGETIAAQVARRAPVQLELGGKNAIIVMAGSDLEQAAKVAAGASMGAAGQRCTAASRVLVEDACFEAFVDMLLAAVRRMSTGDPMLATTDVGPLASAAQVARARELLETARDEHLNLAMGGELADPDDGYYMVPTVFVDVPASSRLSHEETFCPVLVVTRIGGLEEAITLANDTPFGLSAALFTNDVRESFAFIRDMDAGVLSVNRGTTGGEIHAPFGGLKASGTVIRELGTAAREFFTVTQTIYLAHG